MALPSNTANAVATLHSMVNEIAQSVAIYPTAPIVPGDVTVPEPRVIAVSILWGVGTQPRTVVVWPAERYSAWRSAWETLVGYAGWWGSRARWPLGDGQQALSDPSAAAALPPAASALPAVQGSLISVESPGWKPDVNPWAVGAPIIFLGGLATAVIQFMQWRERTGGASSLLGYLGAILQNYREWTIEPYEGVETGEYKTSRISRGRAGKLVATGGSSHRKFAGYMVRHPEHAPNGKLVKTVKAAKAYVDEYMGPV